eukprot:s2332_g5.t1
MAKQFLRALSVFSVMSLAEGSWSPISSMKSPMSGILQKLHMVFIDALGQRHMFAFLFICMAMFVVYMHPGPSNSGDNRDVEDGMEPSSEPDVSRYPTSSRSLGLKYPRTFSDAMLRAEGIIAWLHDRCEKRISRGNKRVLNGFRKETLKEMISLCVRGMTNAEQTQMRENLHSMQDLTDDEESPRFGMSDAEVGNEVQQAVQAFDFGLDLLRVGRDAGTENTEENDAEMNEQGESESETDEQRRYRFFMATVDEVSQPDLWHEIQAEFHDEAGDGSQGNESSESAGDETPEARRRR